MGENFLKVSVGVGSMKQRQFFGQIFRPNLSDDKVRKQPDISSLMELIHKGLYEK